MWWLREVGDPVDVTVFVTVYPDPGNFPVIARALLEVADHPSQVRMVTWPQSGFEVPEDVFERFEAAMNGEQPDTRQDVPAAETEPPKRRPGRPRKNPEPDTSKEE
jgi:Glu-tRNA(Gln) amidotransferase subunit E-like FAD-binding protein